jgi:hypothetical protein
MRRELAERVQRARISNKYICQHRMRQPAEHCHFTVTPSQALVLIEAKAIHDGHNGSREDAPADAVSAAYKEKEPPPESPASI